MSHSFVCHEFVPNAISLVKAPIVVDSEDYAGIHIAAATLAEDFAKVTGEIASVVTSEQTASEYCIIIGSVQRSKTIQKLVVDEKIDTTTVQGKWETWHTKLIEAPWKGCKTALVICGSDKRGAIFGTYTLSEQIGVSPYVSSYHDNRFWLIQVQLELVGRCAYKKKCRCLRISSRNTSRSAFGQISWHLH
jgi:hypothetical protein